VEDSHGKFVEEITCDFTTLCVLWCCDIWSVTAVVPAF
jgi:hypothetical protein